ncbi:MAG: MMPL family transporter [bacterium]
MADPRPGLELRYVAALLRVRGLVLALIAVLTGASAFFAARVGFDANIESWFVEGDANLSKYHEFLDKFGADEVSVVGVFSDQIFTPAGLKALDAFTHAVEEAPYTHRVSALTNARIVKRLGPGHVGIEAFLEALPDTAEEAAEVRAAALADPLLAGNLLAKDGRATAVVVELTREGNTFAAKVEHVQALRALMATHLAPAGLEAHLAGSPALDDAMFTATERDFGLFGPLGAAVLVLMMLVLFRRFSAVIVPLSVVGIACCWLFGLMGALGIDITLISSSLVVLIMAVGVADSVHVLSDYYQALMHGRERDDAVRHAVSSLLVPCLFTSLTTAAGFLSLLVGDLQPIREFGWLAAVGVMFAFILE